MRKIVNIASYMCLFIIVSCKPTFEQIEYGKDACANCRMTIVDRHFAAEMVTGKGRTYKFDDIKCMKQYLHNQNEKDANAQFYVANYRNSEMAMLNAKGAIYVENEFFSSPMNGNCAAFATVDDARYYTDSLNEKTITWSSIK